MPTIAVNKAELYERLERQYTTKEFDELCFDYGIELDEDTTEEVEELQKKGLAKGEEPQLKIEIPANRYDLLCIEGLARALRMFLGKDTAPPIYRVSTPAAYQEVFVDSSITALRPFFASAILHLAKPFTPSSYKSFIDLQDKLHANLCRQRRLVAIGTHDLDTLHHGPGEEGSFRYVGRKKEDVSFVPLGKVKRMNGPEMMEMYEADRHLSKFTHIIKDSPVFPLIVDKNDTVLSMPPIINSDHSKITLQTRNIFVDVTATDKTKLNIVVNMVVTMFSEYCQVPFEVEQVKVHMPDGTSHLSPDLSSRSTTASASYINAAIGLSLSPSEMCDLLRKMSIPAQPSPADPTETLLVEIPPTRPDILHECDIMEDVGIAYGFNNLTRSLPVTNTVAKPFSINRLGDVIRKECAQAGWTEVLPLILCSYDENFAHLNRTDPGKLAIRLTNPATAEYQVVRTSLLPGLLKTLRENRSMPLPLRIFECSDVAFQDLTTERQARNARRLGAVYCDKKGGFEVVHGLLDRLMQILEVPFLGSEQGEGSGYYIKESEDPTYFPGRAATIHYRPAPPIPADSVTNDTLHSTAVSDPAPSPVPAASAPSPLQTIAAALKSALPSSSPAAPKDILLGSLGILHPSVLEKFSINYPCSALEIDVEAFL